MCSHDNKHFLVVFTKLLLNTITVLKHELNVLGDTFCRPKIVFAHLKFRMLHFFLFRFGTLSVNFFTDHQK